MRNLIAILILALIVGGLYLFYSGSKENRYLNERLGFSLVKPDEVIVEPEGENRVKFMYLGPDAIANSEITDGYAIIVSQDEVLGTISLRTYAEGKVAGAETNMSTNVSELTRVELNGTEAYKYSFTNLLGSQSTEYVLASKSGRVYLISYVVADPNSENYERKVLEMIESFKIEE